MAARTGKQNSGATRACAMIKISLLADFCQLAAGLPGGAPGDFLAADPSVAMTSGGYFDNCQPKAVKSQFNTPARRS